MCDESKWKDDNKDKQIEGCEHVFTEISNGETELLLKYEGKKKVLGKKRKRHFDKRVDIRKVNNHCDQ